MALEVRLKSLEAAQSRRPSGVLVRVCVCVYVVFLFFVLFLCCCVLLRDGRLRI